MLAYKFFKSFNICKWELFRQDELEKLQKLYKNDKIKWENDVKILNEIILKQKQLNTKNIKPNIIKIKNDKNVLKNMLIKQINDTKKDQEIFRNEINNAKILLNKYDNNGVLQETNNELRMEINKLKLELHSVKQQLKHTENLYINDDEKYIKNDGNINGNISDKYLRSKYFREWFNENMNSIDSYKKKIYYNNICSRHCNDLELLLDLDKNTIINDFKMEHIHCKLFLRRIDLFKNDYDMFVKWLSDIKMKSEYLNIFMNHGILTFELFNKKIKNVDDLINIIGQHSSNDANIMYNKTPKIARKNIN